MKSLTKTLLLAAITLFGIEAFAQKTFPELMEKGFEGKEWIRMWLEEQQIYGDVEQGNRNNVLAQMVKDMRYVFGSADELKEALPDWGLPQRRWTRW